jgi:hypothetical protein
MKTQDLATQVARYYAKRANTPAQRMTLKQYWDHVGTQNIVKVIERVGSSLPYFRAMRYGQKPASVGYALRVIEAARKVTPGWEPDLDKLTEPVKVKSKPAPRSILPSREFAASKTRKAD